MPKKINTPTLKIMTIKKRIRQRNYCFTDFELLNFKKIYKEYKDIIRYLCYGVEITPSTNRKHYQGWVQFNNQKDLNKVKQIFGSKKIHLEACKGNEEQNNKYCKKDHEFVYFGAYKYQGQRTDLEEIKKRLYENDSLLSIADDYQETFYRYYKGIEKHKQLILQSQTKKFRKIKTIIYWGDTNTGKTRTAVEKNPNAFKITGSNLKWWDGYEGEKTLIIDEYDNDMNITKLLNILDGYQLRLDIKGSFTYARWTKVIITSNIDPDFWHLKAKQQHRDALFRRITKIKNFNNLQMVQSVLR